MFFKKFYWIILIFVFLIAQIFILMGLVQYAIITLIMTVGIISIVFIFSRKDKFYFNYNLSEILLILSIFLGIIATIVVKTFFLIALLMYFIAAVFLFLANPKILHKDLLENVNKKEKFEPYFLIFLILFTVGLRFFGLNDIPAGIYGHELIQMGEAAKLSNNYVWHMGAGAEWPTMTLYQGLFFAKIFGWSIGSFRMEGAFWGTMTVIIFYFLARRMFSPLPAAFAALLFSSNDTQLLVSRNLAPNPILYASILIATWFFIVALKNKKWYFFCLSGLMLGFTLHGYMAGRILPAILAIFGLYFLVFKRQTGFSLKHILIMILGFSISAGPIIYYSFMHPDIYWTYLNSVNPNANKGVSGYVKTILDNLPTYAKSFHIKGDYNPSMNIPCKNILEPVAGTLFPIGFFLTVFMFFKPVNLYLLTFFILCILPALLGGGSSTHPTLSRMLGVLPPLYLMIALTFDQIKNVIDNMGNKVKKLIYLSLGLIIVIVGVFNGIHRYFFETTTNKEFRMIVRYDVYLAAKETEKFKDHKIIIGPKYNYGYFYKQNIDYKVAFWPEDYLLMDLSSDYLLLIDTYMEGIIPFFKKYFPGSDIKIYSEPQENIGKYCINLISDTYNKYTYLIRVKIPAKDIESFHCMLDATTLEKVNIFDNNFSQKFSGKKLKLKGTIILKEFEKSAKININWVGWNVITDIGKKKNSGDILYPGINYFVIEGMVPEEASGPLPLEIITETGAKLGRERLAALDNSYGFKVKFISEEKENKESVVYTRNNLFPFCRIYDGYSAKINVPFTILLSSQLKVDKNGRYYINTEEPSKSKIILNNKTIKNNIKGESINNLPVELNSNELNKLDIYFIAQGGNIDRTFKLKLNETNMPFNYIFNPDAIKFY